MLYCLKSNSKKDSLLIHDSVSFLNITDPHGLNTPGKEFVALKTSIASIIVYNF